MIKRPRDSQRSRVYGWEKVVANELSQCPKSQFLVVGRTLQECATLANLTADQYGVPRPVVTDGRGRRRPGATSVRIALPRFARNYMITLHETAHFIERNALPEVVPAHGREFVGLYMALLVRHGACVKMLTSSANKARIDFAPPAIYSARKIKPENAK